MVRSIEQLRSTTDDELIAEHDKKAEHTVVGTDYYMRELERRQILRAMASSERLARRAVVLTAANALLAAVAVAIALFG